MTKKPTSPFDAQLQAMPDEDLAAWSFRNLAQQVLREEGQNASDAASIDNARKMLVAGAEAMLRRGADLQLIDRVDFYGDLEMIVEGALRLGVYGSEEHAPKQEAQDPPPVPEAQKAVELITPVRGRRRPLGIRARVIVALQKLYPNGDPVTAQGLRVEEVRCAVEDELGQAVSPRTLDRSREAAFAG